MSLLQQLRARAGQLVRGGAVEAPVSPLAAAPIAGRLGTLVLTRGSAGPTDETVPSAWGLCPESGAALPTGPKVQVSPFQFVAARKGLRHGWFASAAWGASPERALEGMSAWLRQDLPGQGLAWAHPTDLAVRMVHWHAGLSFLAGRTTLPDSLRDAMAGSADWHMRHLSLRLPQGERDVLRRVVHYAGLVVAGFTFPEVPRARDAWSSGLSGLKQELPELTFDDGSPKDVAPLVLADALWQVAIARTVAAGNGAGFPASADAALARGARFLERLGAGLVGLPNVGEAPVAPVLDNAESVSAALWDACLAWGIEPGEAAAMAAPSRLGWLGVSMPQARPEIAKTWSMRVWRQGGIAAGECRIKNRNARMSAWFGSAGRRSPLTHGVPLHLLWDVGEVTVLADPGPGFWSPGRETDVCATGSHSALLLDGRQPPEAEAGELTLGRVDGKKARVEGTYGGWRSVGIALDHRRQVLFNQARCIVTDTLSPGEARIGRHAVVLRWQLGPGWDVARDGDNWVAKQAGMTLVVQLPSLLSWEVVTGRGAPSSAGWVNGQPAPCFVGNGGIEAETELVSSFEVR